MWYHIGFNLRIWVCCIISGNNIINVVESITMQDDDRSEEHTSELQSRPHLVCRLLLEKKKNYDSFASERNSCGCGQCSVFLYSKYRRSFIFLYYAMCSGLPKLQKVAKDSCRRMYSFC